MEGEAVLRAPRTRDSCLGVPETPAPLCLETAAFCLGAKPWSAPGSPEPTGVPPGVPRNVAAKMAAGQGGGRGLSRRGVGGAGLLGPDLDARVGRLPLVAGREGPGIHLVRYNVRVTPWPWGHVVPIFNTEWSSDLAILPIWVRR